jgi:hypothetical protein
MEPRALVDGEMMFMIGEEEVAAGFERRIGLTD